MPNFSTNMNEWGGAYAAPRTVNKQDSSGGLGEALAKLIPGALDAVGTGYARAQGLNLVGGNTTAEEAQVAVTAFEEAAPFSQDGSNTPDQKAVVDDMRNAALRKFGTDDKKIQALVSAGKISTVEANARRHQMLQENLSNPVLSMFKEDFLDAATPFTGGNGKLAEQYFGAYMPTEEERIQAEAIDKVITEKAKFEAQVAGVMSLHGVDKAKAEGIIRKQLEDEAYLANLESQYKVRQFTSQESFMAGMTVVDDFMQKTGGAIANIAATGRKLGANEMQQLAGGVNQQYLAAREKLVQFGNTMTTEDYNKALGKLEDQRKLMDDMIKDSDGMAFMERSVKALTLQNEATIGRVTADFLKVMPHVFVANKVSPQFGEAMVNAIGDGVSGQFAIATNPYWSKLVQSFGYADMTKASTDAHTDIANDKTDDWSFTKAAGFVMSMFEPGRAAKAVDAVEQKPNAYRAMFESAMSSPEASLSPFADSDEMRMASKTPKGAKAVAMAVQAKVSKSLIPLQLQTGKGLPTDLKMERIQHTLKGGAPGGKEGVRFNTKDLDPTVGVELLQIDKILRNSPQVMKELGVSTPEEYINKCLRRK